MRARPCAHIATFDELPYLKESGVCISALYLSMLLFMLCLNLNSLNLDTARFVFSRSLLAWNISLLGVPVPSADVGDNAGKMH